MRNLDMLKKQHSEILELVKKIETLTRQDVKDVAKEIAFHINALSGKLKVHLMSEDKFLYPDLMKNQNEIVRNTAQKFNEEMGGLADTLNTFVQQYNTYSKILQNENSFKSESKTIFRVIMDRMHREDHNLYLLIEK
ncbi:hemerythrin domain-containing protein [Anaerosinus massiliensis]|uniref:hemerythrin domain-containing protein n=1 Tax=Massilibacillus massiliensis TaxID=1806837 RepID=UPI000DA60742|nr:hemerythrin domain-containing protein [Massilibacillus massiliensis]